MPDYRRWFHAGGTYFFTVVTFNRQKIFRDARARTSLRQAMLQVQALRPFETLGIVLLPDHCHCIWKMTPDDDDFSVRWRMIKRRFTRLWLAGGGLDGSVSGSRMKRGERGVWQRRFWEHLIRDQQDFAKHMDYIHYNPVKHGHVRCPHQWKHSSFDRWVKEGVYMRDWLCQCQQNYEPPNFEAISQSTGE